AREQAMLERERRAQLQYARQVEERWRRLEEQRQREELRRAAVEEKRRQRMEEEKERLEALMRRSLERSLQLEHRPKRWTWGGATGGREALSLFSVHVLQQPWGWQRTRRISDSPRPAARLRCPVCVVTLCFLCSGSRCAGDCEYAPPLPVGLPAALAPPPDLGAPPPDLATDSLSASTMNLPKHSEPPISKRLSSSSATITHSAERGNEFKSLLTRENSLLMSRCHRTPAWMRRPRKFFGGLSSCCPRPCPPPSWALPPQPPGEPAGQLPPLSLTLSSCKTLGVRTSSCPGGTGSEVCSPVFSIVLEQSRGQIAPPQLGGEDPALLSGMSRVCSRVAAPSPHRSPYRGSPGRAERRKTSAGSPESSEESAKVALSPDTPKLEKPRKEKRMSSPLPGSPLRRVESPAVPAKRPSSPATPKLPQKTRPQSPSTARPYPPSPMKPRAPGAGSESARKRGDPERGQPEPLRAEAQEKKLPKSASSELSNREGGERSAEPSPVTPTGKPIAGTTDAEEASRLLAERRRQARLQRELEERQQREQEEAERVRAEEARRKMAEERARQEEEARRAEEERLREEEEQRLREEAERQQRERQARELQARLDREVSIVLITPVCSIQREEAEARAQQEAERLRQERELQQLQMEQERLQRKKRIEEIMKRTRKSDTFETKKEEVKLETRTAVSFLRPVQSALLESRVIGRGIAQPPPAASEVPGAPLISLEPLEVKSGSADESADEVQPMDVRCQYLCCCCGSGALTALDEGENLTLVSFITSSPVSKEELISIPEFSPLNERHPNEMSNAKALEDLLDLTGHVSYPPLTSPSAALGDCNKNLIEGFCSSSPDTQLIESLAQAVDKANIQ
ncbi:MA7D2 protein, partial [Atractosteus spatula]|nr:MA7D2 protein [Atractosteus spatula]